MFTFTNTINIMRGQFQIFNIIHYSSRIGIRSKTMMFFALFLAAAVVGSRHVNCLQQSNYYWREYTGTIPQDAIVGGQDINGKDIYIGQAYIKDKGLIVAQIESGVREVSVPIYGIQKVDRYVKILCGLQSNLYWTPVNGTSLPLSLISKHPVIGGHEDNWGLLYIGRISYEGEIRLGKINAFDTENAYFWFYNKDKETRSSLYEILLFNADVSPE